MAGRSMTSSSSIALEMSGIHHEVCDHFSLDIEQLRVAQGETFCLIGPTGAGKSTLLRLLSGLELPTQGTIAFEGQSLSNRLGMLSVQRKISTAHQTPLLLTGSVRSNVEYGLRVRQMTDLRQRVDRVLDDFGIFPLADQEAHTLSGGQKQLVAIARAMVFHPELLLLDEPTAHLDPATVALVESIITRLREQQGTTIVWVTHNLFQARRMGTSVGLILQGELIEAGPTERFFESPADARTSAFIQGKMVY